jgi:hypothetical protein
MVTATLSPLAAIGVALAPVQSTDWPADGVVVGAQAALAAEVISVIATRAVDPSKVFFMTSPVDQLPDANQRWLRWARDIRGSTDPLGHGGKAIDQNGTWKKINCQLIGNKNYCDESHGAVIVTVVLRPLIYHKG